MSIPKARPIIFTGESVRAILDGRKTMTRRVVKPQPDEDGLAKVIDGPWQDTSGRDYRCPYGVPGDRLWVRETWAPCDTLQAKNSPEAIAAIWRADFHGDNSLPEVKWRPSIHMPRWASRLDLEISAVYVERVQEISEADAMAEGAQSVLQFAELWDTINQLRGYGWSHNPWCWCISFRRFDNEIRTSARAEV